MDKRRTWGYIIFYTWAELSLILGAILIGLSIEKFGLKFTPNITFGISFIIFTVLLRILIEHLYD